MNKIGYDEGRKICQELWHSTIIPLTSFSGFSYQIRVLLHPTENQTRATGTTTNKYVKMKQHDSIKSNQSHRDNYKYI